MKIKKKIFFSIFNMNKINNNSNKFNLYNKYNQGEFKSSDNTNELNVTESPKKEE